MLGEAYVCDDFLLVIKKLLFPKKNLSVGRYGCELVDLSPNSLHQRRVRLFHLDLKHRWEPFQANDGGLMRRYVSLDLIGEREDVGRVL